MPLILQGFSEIGFVWLFAVGSGPKRREEVSTRHTGSVCHKRIGRVHAAQAADLDGEIRATNDCTPAYPG